MECSLGRIFRFFLQSRSRLMSKGRKTRVNEREGGVIDGQVVDESMCPQLDLLFFSYLNVPPLTPMLLHSPLSLCNGYLNGQSKREEGRETR